MKCLENSEKTEPHLGLGFFFRVLQTKFLRKFLRNFFYLCYSCMVFIVFNAIFTFSYFTDTFASLFYIYSYAKWLITGFTFKLRID